MTDRDNRGFEYDNGQAIDLKDRNDFSHLKMDAVDTPDQKTEQFKPQDKSYIQKKLEEHSQLVKVGSYIIIHGLVIVYFSFATYWFDKSEKEDSTEIGDDKVCHGKCGFQWCDGYGMLLLLLTFIYFGLFYYKIFKPMCGKKIYRNYLIPATKCIKLFLKSKIVIAALIVVLLIVFGVFIYFQTENDEARLIGLIGPVLFILAGYVFSTDRKAIKWRPVVCGIACQFVLGIVCIRWQVGRNVFECLGKKVATFLSFTDEGSKFVFGEQIIKDQIFAFVILPVIFFFSFCISILYYYGIMQWIITKLGWILQKILGTTVCESVNSAGNIFLGMTESPLLIRPYIQLLTKSELHAIMGSGFATVSGTVLAAYISFGAKPALLITSTVMAAPGALAISKLYYPETEESRTKSDNIKLEKSKENSVLDAATSGASIAIDIVLGIVANLVSFVAFIAFINSLVSWLGYLVGTDGITFEWLFAKLFIPISWILGVPWEDCEAIAEIIATKTIINEFVAYQRLGKLIESGNLQARSIGIATFAICGFANPSSLGISIGTLGAMAPHRRSDITSVAMRAFVVGCVVCFISASFAGILMTKENLEGLRHSALNDQ